MHVDTEYKWEKMVASSFYLHHQVPWLTRTGLDDISAAMFVLRKWCHMQYSNLFKLFVNVSTFPYYGTFSSFDACFLHVSLIHCDIANAATYIQECIHYESNFRGCALYSGLPALKKLRMAGFSFYYLCFLTFAFRSQAQLQKYNQVTPSFWLCALTLGYAVHIFRTTDFASM